MLYADSPSVRLGDWMLDCAKMRDSGTFPMLLVRKPRSALLRSASLLVPFPFLRFLFSVLALMESPCLEGDGLRI